MTVARLRRLLESHGVDARLSRAFAALAAAGLVLAAGGCTAAETTAAGAEAAAAGTQPAAASGTAVAAAGGGGRDEAPEMTVLAASDGPHRLADREVRIALEPVVEGSPAALLAALADPAAGERLHLVLRDLAVGEPPPGLFHLYVDLAPGEEPADDDPRHLGSLNFFGVETGGATAEARGYELTAHRERLAAALRAGRPLTVTFRSSSPAAAAAPRIGRVELLAG